MCDGISCLARLARKFTSMLGIASDRLGNSRPFRNDFSEDQSLIHLFHRMILELSRQSVMDPIVFRDDHHSGRTLVQTVDDPGAEGRIRRFIFFHIRFCGDIAFLTLCRKAEMMQECVDKGPLKMSWSRMDYHAGGFVDHGQIVVFVEDVEGNVFGRRLGDFRGTAEKFDLLPPFEDQARLGLDLAVDPHEAVFDELLHLRTAIIRVPYHHHMVEPLGVHRVSLKLNLRLDQHLSKSRGVITLSNGHSFEFMTASGALAFDGGGWPWEWPLRWAGFIDPPLFTNVAKTLSRHPRKGNLRWTHPWSVVKNLPEGVVNAIGLTNSGVDWWIEKVAPRLDPKRPLVVSIEADIEDEALEMIELLNPFADRLKGLELNLSCPNTPTTDQRSTEKLVTVCQEASKTSRLPLIAKISYTHDYKTLALEFERSTRIEALAINSVPWKLVHPDRPSPLQKFGGGGVSGRLIQKFTWKMVEELSRATKIPVIGPSVWEYEDIQKLFDLGAKAISFGSIFVQRPWAPTLYVRRYKGRT